MKPFFLYCCMIPLLLRCSPLPDSPASPDVFRILKTRERFLSEIQNLNNLKGVLPDNLVYPDSIRNNSNFIFKIPGEIIGDGGCANTYHEFFAYDQNTVIIILSAEPEVHFLKILTSQFYSHLENEFNGIRTGQRRKNTVQNYKKIGNYFIGIFFTPHELNRWNNDRRITVLKDLFSAAGRLILYEPEFRETQIHADFINHVQNQKDFRAVYHRKDHICNLAPYVFPADTSLPFPVILGTGLTLTEDLLDNEDPMFIDTSELTRDFAVFFSLLLGNPEAETVREGRFLMQPTSGTPSKMGNYGIVVVVRGDMNRDMIPFFKEQNIPLGGELPLSLHLEDREDRIFLDWGENRQVNVLIQNEDLSFSLINTVQGSEYQYSPIVRGKSYTFMVETTDKKSRDKKSLILGKDPEPGELKITELLWMGSSTANNSHASDEFIEIKNSSPDYIRLNPIAIHIQGTKQIPENSFQTLSRQDSILAPGEYFLIINDKSYLFDESGNGFNLSEKKIKHLADPSLSLLNTPPYDIQIMKNSMEIDKAVFDGNAGSNGTREERSMVLDKQGIWATSIQDMGISYFQGHTFGTPGWSEANEY